MKAIDQAPDAVRDRFAAWRKARSGAGTTDEASSPWRCRDTSSGSDAAVSDLKTADALWQAATWSTSIWPAAEAAGREDMLAKLEALAWPADRGRLRRLPQARPGHPDRPAHAAAAPRPRRGGREDHGPRVLEDENDEPTEYAVRLPPEYHPLRSYPAIVVLHPGQGPQSAIEAWAAEAARRGYILIAPEYNVPGQPPDYRYTPSEHAAVELALRDARKRYAIDSDRVFVAGQLTGGNMAWDFAPGPSRPVRRRGRDLRLPGQVCSPLSCRTTSGCRSTS